MQEQSEQLERIRHSCSHVLAMAVLRLYPDAKLGIGVATKDGFFHDFELSKPMTIDDLAAIQAEMQSIALEQLPFTQMALPRDLAINTLLQRGQIYKVELVRESESDDITFYKTGTEFIDACKGPHIASTDELRAFKLTSISGAYWKSDEERPQLTRIHGLAFRTEAELDEYTSKQQELLNVDVRKTSKLLDYWAFHGNKQLYSPLGTFVIDQLESTIVNMLHKNDYLHAELGLAAGDSYDRFKTYFQGRNRSYRDLPVKVYTTCINQPAEGYAYNGRAVQWAKEYQMITMCSHREYLRLLHAHLQTSMELLESFKLDYEIAVTTPSADNDIVGVVSDFLRQRTISHTQVIDAESQKVTIHLNVSDKFDRKWELLTTKITYPSDTLYTSREGELVATFNIVSTFTIEQLYIMLMENKDGLLPIWLSPLQAVVVPVSTKHIDYAEKVVGNIEQLGLSIKLDSRSDKLEGRIRDAEVKRIPIIIVVGDKELSSQTVSLRIAGQSEVGLVELSELTKIIQHELAH